MAATTEEWSPPEVATTPGQSWTPPEAAEQAPSTPTPAANATFDRRMDALYSGGLDNVHNLLSDQQKGQLDELLQRSDNPGEMKAQMVNRAYLAHNYPEMAPYLDDNWAAVKKQYAKSALGVDKPEVSDTELFSGIRGIYNQRRVLQETAGEMGAKIVEAAYQGNADYRTLVPKIAKPEQQAQLDEYAAKVDASVRDQAHLLSPHVIKVASLMEQFRNGGDQSLLPQMVDEVEHLDPQTRELVVNMAARKVHAEMGEADDNALEKVGQRLDRGVATMVQGVRSMAANLTVGQTAGQGKNPYALDTNREDTRTQILSAYNAIGDPVESKNLLGKVALGLASFAPQMAVIMANPAIGLPAVFAESQNQRASELMGQGVDRTKAFAMAAPQAMVDALSQMVSTNIVFKGALAPIEQTAARSMGEVALRTLKVAGAEAVTLSGITAAQQFMPAAMQDWGHRLDQSIPETQWADSEDGKTKGMLHNLKDALPETALSVVALMMLGTGRAGLAETSKFMDSLGHVDALKAAGYTPEQANKVADQASPQERLRVLQSMKPEAVNTPAQAEAIAKLNAENKAAQQDRSAIISKSDDGMFTIADADGKRIGSATTEDAANDIKAQYDQTQTHVSRGMKSLSDSIGGEEAKTEGEKPAGEAKTEPAAETPLLRQVAGTQHDAWADKVLADFEALPPEEQKVTPEVVAAITVKGAGLLEAGVTDFDRWSGEMRDMFGENIEPHLRGIYDNAVQLHGESPERGAEGAAKSAMDESWNGEEAAGGARAHPNEDGTWTVLDAEGNEVGKADTPEQAVDLVHQANKAESSTLTDALNDSIDYFKERGSRGAVEQTGKKRTVRDMVKEGQLSEKKARELVKLYIDLGILEPGTTPAQARIYGENARVFNARTQLYDYVTRLHAGADPLVLIEEKTEEYFKQQLDRGVFTLADAEKWRSELEGKPFTPNADEAMREREATEWFSKHAQAYMTGKATEDMMAPIPQSIRRWLRKMKEAFAQTFALARDLMEKEKAGQLPDGFKKHLARSVGLDEAFLERRAREEEGQAAKAGGRDQYTAREALHAIGLPTPKTDLTGMSGELSNLYESMKFNEKMALFGRKRVGEAGQFENAKGLDEVAERLRSDYGFSWVKGPDDVIKLAEDTFLHGKEILSDTSMALRKPKGDKTADMFDSGLANEDFTLAGEKTEDHAGAVDSEEARREAQKQADAAQGEMTFALRKVEEDRAEYDRLQAEMKAMGVDKFGTPEYNALWQQSEDIKNRHGGMPPGETAGATYALRQAPFYSRLTRTVEESKQEKASGDQWKAMIRNSKLGVNKGEYDLVGVDDLEPGKSYTKQEVLDYLKANGVKVQDVTLGGENKGVHDSLVVAARDAIQRNDQFGFDRTRDAFKAVLEHKDWESRWEVTSPEDVKAINDWRESMEARPKPTHFDQYTLPGAVEGSYREVLLTVPEMAEPDKKAVGPLVDDGAGGMVRATVGGKNWQDGHSQYSDVKNPIVRLRTNERTAADGKKMLFIEEVQAPQKGEFAKMPELFQKNWREIGFKYALRKAVEGGFDSLGWTRGDQQAERYDLSKHLDMVRIGPSRDYEPDQRIYHVSGYKDGSMVLNQGDIHEQQLADYVGKELADRASKDNAHAGTKEYSGLDLKVGGEGLRKLYDQDFRNVVNGLPVVRKSGQKAGMEEVGTGDERTFKGAATLEQVEQMVAKRREYWTNPDKNPDEPWQNWNTSLDGQAKDVIKAMKMGAPFDGAMAAKGSPALAEVLGGEFIKEPVTQTVHSIDITPEMRAAVEGGQATFALRKQTATPEFKKWFGESKVVDDNGEPKVVYHGTKAKSEKGFAFDYSRIMGRNEGAGFYFTDSKQVASGYGQDGTVLESYLSLQKPMAYDHPAFDKPVLKKLVTRIAEMEAEKQGADIEDGFLANYGDARSEGLNSTIAKAVEGLAPESTALDQISGIVGSGVPPEIVNRAVTEVTGFDGVVAKGFSNAGAGAHGVDQNIYVAFHPEQVKSATGNSGAFDRNNPDITMALRPHGLPEVAKEGKPGQQPLPGEIEKQAKEEQLRAAKENVGLSKFGPFREALNRFVGANQLTSLRVEREVKRIMKEVPDASRRVAITNYLQANGDLGVLKDRAEASKPAYRKGYEDAMKLTPQEKSVAASVSQFYKDMLVNLQRHGVVDAGIENYVNQMWKQEILGGDLKSPHANSRLMTDLRNAKERTFGSYFEGEQYGKVPVTKDIAHLMAIYATEAGKVVASRRFLKDLTTKKAPDGRPLAAVQGQIQDGENVGVETGDKEEGPTFIKANAHPEGYKTIDNPAFQGWKWLGKDKAGEPVMMKGQMALHPDVFRHVQNVFGESAIDRMLRPNPANGPLLEGAKTFVRSLLKAQTFAKGTTLGFLSPFHQVQEGTHAVGHHVNPFWGSPDHLLDADNPLTRHAVEHGLMIAGDGQAMQMFKDSIDSNLVHAIPGMLGKIPGVGEGLQKAGESSASPITWSKDYAHYLFHSYIPRLKMKTFMSIEANNLERYAAELKKGTVTRSDVAYLSAKQTNNAYGHLNWHDIGVDPTLLHIARITLLAPDFLAARAAFTGEAIKGAAGKKSGREQVMAFATLAATQYITARILNKFSDDDYHFADHPFSVVHDGREYTMRSVPEDLYKLVKQPEQFIKGRISPGANMLQEALFQRNFRGEKVDYKDELKDMVSMFIPITLRANPIYRQYLETGGKSTVSVWQQMVGAAGIHISRNSPIAETYKLAADFKKNLSEEDKKKFGVVDDKGVYPTSKYQQLRYALEDGDLAKAMKEWEKLKEAGAGAQKLDEGFHESLFHPFTGSKHLDAAFAKSLPEEKKAMLELARHSREQIWTTFKHVERGDIGLAGK